MSKLPTWPFIIIAALIGILGTYTVRRYIAFQNASIKFHKAILNELKDIYPNPVNWPKNTLNIKHILESKFINLQVAIEEFRGALPWYKIKGFDKAWLCYHCSPNYRKDKNCQEYSHYIPCKSTSIVNGKQITDETTLESCKEAFKHNVDTLLKFANK